MQTLPDGPPRAPALFFGREGELERYLREMPRVRLSLVYGPGGVGKTAFALQASEALARELGARRAWVRCRPGESAVTLAAAAAASLAGTPPTNPIEALLGAGPLVLVIDDAHVGDVAAVPELAEYLVTRSTSLHVCIASRTSLPLSPLAVDHLVVKLAGLDAASASELWSALESLYGPRTRPPDAGPLAGGNPLLIKCAFADLELGEDSLGLADLAPLARQLLVELCALRGAASLPMLAAGRDEGEVASALKTLERRFLVERTGDRVSAHDVIREAVERSRWRPGRPEHARWIEHYRADHAVDEVALVELLHHAVAAEEDALVIELLRAEIDRFRRLPPGTTVLDRLIREAVDWLDPRMELPPELRLLRARVRARQGEVRAALEELERARADGLAGGVIDCDRADVAFLLGRAEDALAISIEVLDDPKAHAIAHLRALAVAVAAAHATGDMAQALELTHRQTAALRLVPSIDGVRAWLRAAILADHERYGDAAAEVVCARDGLAAVFPSALPMLGTLGRTVDALVGTTADPREDADDLFDENAFFRCLARLLLAQEHLTRGRTREAATLAEETWALAEYLDLFPVVSWASWMWAEAACVLGEHDAVVARVPRLLERCEATGHLSPRLRLSIALAEAHLALGQLERARDLAVSARDLARGFPRSLARADFICVRAGRASIAGTTPPSSPPSGIALAEAQLSSAELALDRGALDDARRDAAEAETSSRRFGWHEIACRADLALAEIALRRGDLGAVRFRIERATRRAHEEGYTSVRAHGEALSAALARGETSSGQAPLPRRAHPAAGRLRLHEPVALELATDAGRIYLPRGFLDELHLSGDWVIDRIRGRVGRADKLIDLSRRETLLDLVVALADPPGSWLTAGELTQRAWQLDYHSVRHHSRLAMAIARLREAIGEDSIETGRSGYRLAPVERWRLLRLLPSASDGKA